MSRRRQWAMGIVGLVVFFFGIATTVGALELHAEFSRDSACTRSVTLATAPRVGKTCSIVSGTVARKYRRETPSSTMHRVTEDHIVVFTSDGSALDVVRENEFWSHLYDSATHGAPAVVETVDGRPAFIAAAAGTLSAEADPSLPLAISWIFIPIRAVLPFVSIDKRFPTLTAPKSTM